MSATDELPAHSHAVYVGGYANWPTGSTNLQLFVSNAQSFLNSNGKKYTGPIYKDSAESTGGNQPHNNMPPYYTLAYIMKL